ncbi:hypothetical protein PGT21_005400 [Puccinia graminis f. sp. tritici]|uniref:Uncharacterized protein n=1 Tax=Puccinia graminis f. sp. tritici TaxID=56615 RepID=A0A5B0Q1S5_PUCGR|nr:hypothetical protein PGT21_005400 [Puccinia graminis f. sp. tritici]KAA1137285.1 hypothetical protein PGTUg99_017420 [Puccinia graminis f. sp. tritici]
MNQQHLQKAFYQTENSYETRIQYLEEVVHLLLARTEPLPSTLKSSAPLVGSFRYSITQGLEPVLSGKTAESLPTSWRIRRPTRQAPSRRPSTPALQPTRSPITATSQKRPTSTLAPADVGSPSCRQTFGSTFAPLSLQDRFLIHKALPQLAQQLLLTPLPARSTRSPERLKTPDSPPCLQDRAVVTRSVSPHSARLPSPASLPTTPPTPSMAIHSISATTVGPEIVAKAQEPTVTPPLLDPSTQTTKPAANEIDPTDLPLPSSNLAPQPPSHRPSPPLIDSQPDPASDSLVVLRPELLFTTEADSRPDRLSVLPPPALPLSTETAADTTTVVKPHDTLLDSAAASASITANAATTPTTSRPNADLQATTPAPPPLISPTPPAPMISGSLPSTPEAKQHRPSRSTSFIIGSWANLAAVCDRPFIDVIVQCPEALALSPIAPAGPFVKAGSVSEVAVTAPEPTVISPLRDPSAQTTTLPTSNSDPDTTPNSSHSKNNLPPSPSTPDTTNTLDHHSISVIVIKADNPLPTSFLTNHIACTAATATQTSLTPNQTMENTLPSTPSSSDRTLADNLSKVAPNSSNPVCHQTQPIIPPAQPDNFEVAAVGGIGILDNDDSDSIDGQLAPEYSQATLDYYNDIQEYLQQANAEETETKKKKKKKKKKKANPTSTPDNPILFYV